jgi:hypothetical protein
MRPIGLSTGALAFGDFRKALRMLEGKTVDAVELSALRIHELPELVKAVDSLDLRTYKYISIHAPSSFGAEPEPRVVDQLRIFMAKGWPIVLHPDAIRDVRLWREFGHNLCIENMDKRKPIGRTVWELQKVFAELPEACFCLDIAHARQVDSSMTEAYLLLETFGHRLRQLHISEVDSNSKHDRISRGGSRAFQEIADMIPSETPAILETPIAENEIEEELKRARLSLKSPAVMPDWSAVGNLAIQY